MFYFLTLQILFIYIQFAMPQDYFNIIIIIHNIIII